MEIHKIKFKLFCFNVCAMFKTSAETYADAKVHTITMGKRRLFWVRINDVQDGLGIKNISDLVRKEIHGIFETKSPTKDQIRKYKRSGRKWFSVYVYAYVRSDLMSRIIKNCRGGKGRGEKNR